MTTLYRPVLIESAEQAEALPVGTVATSAQDAGGVWRKRTATSWVKASMKPSLWTNHGIANQDAAITALVPIEAEEETVGYIKYGRFGGEDSTGTRNRLVTPWEEA